VTVIDAGLAARGFFTTRSGGVSQHPYSSLNLAAHVGDALARVAANRLTVQQEAGAPVAFLNAEHGARVHRVTDAEAEVPVADVVVSDTPGVALAALAADCVPLLMHDGATGAVVAAHVGRRGLWAGVVDAAVASLLDLRPSSASSATISASVGPAICGDCYEVPAELRREFAKRHPSAISTTRWGAPALDLPRAVETRLGELGVGQVVRSPHCTFENAAFFSHRRDGVTGRQAGVIVCGVSLRGAPEGAP
jgi:YfiH family protein